MPKNVVCKKCNNFVNGWCKKVIDSPDPDMVRDCRHFWEKTNADRIRAMSDEELVELLCNGKNTFRCSTCPVYECDDNCEKHCLGWLQQPAEVPSDG